MLQIDSYIKEKRFELSTSILNRKTIYLDTNYWIKLREESKKTNPSERLLLTKMFELVESKKCIFPISEISFWEILKQGDPQKLKDTLQLVDKLSEGISIINQDERVHLEFVHFFRSKTGKEVCDLRELVWSKLAFILFHQTISAEEALSSQQSFFDSISNLSLFDIIMIRESQGKLNPFIFKDDIESMNRDKQKYARENKSFHEMFLSELGGYIDSHKESLNESMANLFYMDSGRYPTEEEKLAINENTYRNLIYNEFKLGKIKNELPVLRIIPELFAAVRWNKDRKYKDGNDTVDFFHASFALPYCDFFFTEAELKTIIRERKLDKLYNCRVESNPTKVLEILESIE